MIKKYLLEEYKDYLEEMMNIGSGNAATALEQILAHRFDMSKPSIHVLPTTKASSIIGDPAMPVTCAKMHMVGDIRGDMFFIVPFDQTKQLVALAQTSIDRKMKKADTQDYSVIPEIGNIMAGVYLAAIHDFCNLNIYHTVPVLAKDMVQAILDETIAGVSQTDKIIIVIANQYLTSPEDKTPMETFFLMIPSSDSIKTLMDSIKEAKKLYGA